jgi:hypothetical protein
MPKVNIVGQLLACQLHLGSIDDDDEIACILVGREVGAMFAAQRAGGASRHPAECAAGGVDDDPMASAQRIFMRYASGLFSQLQVSLPVPRDSPLPETAGPKYSALKFGGADGI